MWAGQECGRGRVWAGKECGRGGVWGGGAGEGARCENCAEVSTADLRMRKLMEEAKRWAEDSTYYQTPFDVNVGRA